MPCMLTKSRAGVADPAARGEALGCFVCDRGCGLVAAERAAEKSWFPCGSALYVMHDFLVYAVLVHSFGTTYAGGNF
jgi:hypothetical protein